MDREFFVAFFFLFLSFSSLIADDTESRGYSRLKASYAHCSNDEKLPLGETIGRRSRTGLSEPFLDLFENTGKLCSARSFAARLSAYRSVLGLRNESQEVEIRSIVSEALDLCFPSVLVKFKHFLITNNTNEFSITLFNWRSIKRQLERLIAFNRRRCQNRR